MGVLRKTAGRKVSPNFAKKKIKKRLILSSPKLAVLFENYLLDIRLSLGVGLVVRKEAAGSDSRSFLKETQNIKHVRKLMLLDWYYRKSKI